MKVLKVFKIFSLLVASIPDISNLVFDYNALSDNHQILPILWHHRHNFQRLLYAKFIQIANGSSLYIEL